MRQADRPPRKRPNPASANVVDTLIRQWDAVMAARPPIRIEHERAFDIDMRALRRLAIWGLAATAALAIAVAAAFSDAGARRLMASAPASNAGSAVQKTTPPAAPAPDRDAENRRLAELVGVLMADREQLMTRIGAIERNLEDVTGSIERQAAAAAAASATENASTAVPSAPPPAKEAALAPSAVPAQPAGSSGAIAPAEPTAGADKSATEPVPDPSAAEPTRIEFGVDVGGAVSFDGLRVLWASTRGSNAALFEGLHPVVAARENSRTKAVELRLIAGPLASIEAAARVCVMLAAARRYCQPVAFEGQRLAHADLVPERPERKPAAAPKAARTPAASPKSAFPLR
jgi:hypothetical protein